MNFSIVSLLEFFAWMPNPDDSKFSAFKVCSNCFFIGIDNIGFFKYKASEITPKPAFIITAFEELISSINVFFFKTHAMFSF